MERRKKIIIIIIKFEYWKNNHVFCLKKEITIGLKMYILEKLSTSGV